MLYRFPDAAGANRESGRGGRKQSEHAVELLNLAVIALVQGITEFLPISSSGHLILVPVLTGWPDQGLVIDVAVHVGTLGAVLVYCWRDVGAMLGGLAGLFQRRRRRRNPGGPLLGLVVVATVPVVVAGWLMHHYMPEGIRGLKVIAWTTLVYGIALYAADRIGMTVRRIEHMTWGAALFIGLSQILALIPGTSRSGITMTAARLLGYERPEAARFSMLLAIPAIMGAGLLSGIDLYRSGDLALRHDAALACGLAFLSALVAIALMMAWLRRSSFTPFVVYRILLGGGLLALAYS